MQASIKTKLLMMCILLVLVTTLSISIAYYFLAKQDKHRESQQRLQIALEIILDDLNRQSQFYVQKIDDYLQRDETFQTAINIYLQDQNPLERHIGLRPFLISQLAGLKHIISVDRLALYFADGQLLENILLFLMRLDRRSFQNLSHLTGTGRRKRSPNYSERIVNWASRLRLRFFAVMTCVECLWLMCL